jgi:ADP-heptose:LPS heptosyltransferase
MTANDSKQLFVESEPEQLAIAFLNQIQTSGLYSRQVMERLIDLAVGEDEQTAEMASRAFFTSIVERLADSFEPASVSLYNRALAHLIDRVRSTDGGQMLNRRLKDFRLETEDDLVARAESLRHFQLRAWTPEVKRGIRRVIALSRVTLGADVAITSVIIERMKLEIPDVEIVLVGGRKAQELFGGDPQVSFKEIDYRRAGSVLERLFSWTDVLSAIEETTGDLGRGEYLIVDPDSRLTQLGLLPVGNYGSFTDYLFFSSREYGSDTRRSLGQLTSLWLDELFASSEQLYPSLSLDRNDIDKASELINRMRGGNRPIVSINFGVGGNPLKRLGDEFENSLVARLIADGAIVILDKGAGEEESRRAEAIISSVKRAGSEGRQIRVIETSEEALPGLLNAGRVETDLLVWSGRIGLFAALISESDLYIGYDSAGQHIAAALGVPSIDVFAGYSSPRMLDRWRPAGRAETRVVAVDSADVDESAILSDVLGHAAEIKDEG